MLKNLSYSNKNKLLLAGIALLAILSYRLAFQKTFEAMALHRQLSQKQQASTNLAVSPQYLDHKLNVLNNALDHYKAGSADWKDGFWLKASGIAERNNIRVIYEPGKETALPDTASAVLKQTISFSGGFTGLVKVLDSLEHTKGSGRIMSVEMKEKKDGGDVGRLYMKVVFGALATERSY